MVAAPPFLFCQLLRSQFRHRNRKYSKSDQNLLPVEHTNTRATPTDRYLVIIQTTQHIIAIRNRMGNIIFIIAQEKPRAIIRHTEPMEVRQLAIPIMAGQYTVMVGG